MEHIQMTTGIWQILFFSLLLILLIFIKVKSIKEKMELKVKILNFIVDNLEKNIFEMKNNFDKQLIEKVSAIKDLEMQILSLDRKIHKTKITDSELNYFANNEQNGIKLAECDENAHKVFKKFGGRIYIGKAKVMKCNQLIHETNTHLWNELDYIEDGIEKNQLVDVLNYKEDDNITYSNHSGVEIPEDEVLTDKKHDYIGTA